MVMLCADCNQLKHPGTECQVSEDKPACKKLFFFETTAHVCSNCKSTNWHANLFYYNETSAWHYDDPAFWCGDCDAFVELTPLTE